MELFRALAAMVEAPDDRTTALADTLGLPAPTPADHTDTFLFQLYPYASVHLGADGMLGGDARDRIAGFLRTLGATPPPEPDHLTVLLSAAAELAQREHDATDEDAAAAWRRSRAAWLWEHLLPWVPAFSDRVAAHGGPYAPWAGLLLRALRQEAEAVGPPADVPLHLRMAPELTDPRDGEAGDFLDQLLAPVRTGVIVTRTDLTRCARDLGLGIRVGERRYVLSALLSQAPTDVLAWLGREAQARAADHARHTVWTGPIATFWHDRAAATAGLLDALATDAHASLSAVGSPPTAGTPS